MAKSIQAALLSADASLVSLFQQAALKYEIELVELDDALRFMDLVSQEPFDVMVLDCRGLAGARHLVSALRQASANREAILIIAADEDEPTATSDFGKHLSLAMPFRTEQVEQHFREALPIIEERHRHYDRHPISIDVSVVCPNKNWGLEAKSVNLSEGGIALHLPQIVDLGIEDVVRVSFELPEAGGKIEAQASLAWINNDLLSGFRFKGLTPANSAKLSSWLNLHAPLPGAPRKEIVESWLAQHGKESGTVVISAGLSKQFLSETKLDSKPENSPVQAGPNPQLETLAPSKAKFGWKTVAIFFAGVFIGLLLLQLFHLLFSR